MSASLLAQDLPGDDECQLIAGPRLITMAGDPVSEPTAARDVLVCGELIRAIGAPGSVETPPETARIEAAGKILLPGLVDGHVHVFIPLDLELNLAWGVTGVRNLFGNAGTLPMRERVRSGEQLGPRLWTAGPIVDGPEPIWPGSDAVASATDAKAAVDRQVKQGYDFIKLYSLLEAEPFFAAIDAAVKHGVRVGGHVPGRVPLRDAVEGGMEFIEHLTGFHAALQGADSPINQLSDEQRRALSFSDRSRMLAEGVDLSKLEKVAGWMVEHSVWNVPTFLVIERISASLEQKQAWMEGHPEMRTVNAMARNMWNPSNDFRLQNVTPEQLRARQEAAKLHFPIVKALHEAGAELMLGTDTPNPFVFVGYSVHEELRRFVEAGLTPWEALRTATVQPARFLAQAEVFGKIEVGLAADLLLVDADPLQDIANTEKIAGVMTRGRWLDRGALAAIKERIAKSFGN